SRGLLERHRKALVRVGRPLDDIQRALALADLRRQREALRARADARGRHDQRGQEARSGESESHSAPGNLLHSRTSSSSLSLSIVNVFSGRHARTTRSPGSWGSPPAPVFWVTTVSVPPASRSTIVLVTAP